jgi:tetratricopeptide (TPR) repeat protein
MAFPGRKSLSLLVAAAAVSIFAASALAMSSGGGSMPSGGSDGGWSGPTTSGSTAGKPSEYRQAMKLIKRQDYAGAIPLLLTALQKSPKDPDIMNELGYSYRESGQFDQALNYYRQALAIDPDHAAAREYLGELYLKQNQPNMANIELGELKRICKSGCEARKELEKAIADYTAAHPA